MSADHKTTTESSGSVTAATPVPTDTTDGSVNTAAVANSGEEYRDDEGENGDVTKTSERHWSELSDLGQERSPGEMSIVYFDKNFDVDVPLSPVKPSHTPIGERLSRRRTSSPVEPHNIPWDQALHLALESGNGTALQPVYSYTKQTSV